MPAERYFLDQRFTEGESCELKEAELHHLTVMRTRKGDSIELVNGKGALAEAVVQNLSKDKALLKIERVNQEKELPCRMILAQAIPKTNRLDFILEKGTELGVDRFWLFPGHTSVKKDFFPNQITRARQLTIAAMKQCGRLFLPEVEIKPPLEKWVTLENYRPFFGDIETHAPLFEEKWKETDQDPKPTLMIIGPESGFDDREIGILKKLGAQGVKLHPNILRTDTASIMAVSLVSHWVQSSLP